MTEMPARRPCAAEIALSYHERTKHRLERYAAGPETLDWDDQPNPFREFEGCSRITLDPTADRPATTFGQLQAPVPGLSTPVSVDSIGTLLALSLGLSAWKEYGPDRWAVRCNPSSGNLHPTEAYVLSIGTPGLADGLYHYLSRDHVLEQRCCLETHQPSGLWIALSSVHWREAWKYGERGFRYCQLDIGHAVGSIRYAAGALGWTAKVVSQLGSRELQVLMGLDRDDDFTGVEREDPDLLIAIGPESGPPAPWPVERRRWTGKANRLDRHPMYRWPVIDQVSSATASRCAEPPRLEWPRYPQRDHRSTAAAADIILNRRSAQRYDGKFTVSAAVLYQMLDSLLLRPAAPLDVWDHAPRIHPVFFIHRVEALEPGLYILVRRPDAEHALRDSLTSDFIWRKPAGAPDHLPFFKLAEGDYRKHSRTLNCHQAIARDGCFSLSMLSEFEPIVQADPWRYRQLHWEAGLLGQVLYLEAEAADLRGTGIGCYFDDVLHDLLGITDRRFQALYHFTVGRALLDDRIITLPPYPNR